MGAKDRQKICNALPLIWCGCLATSAAQEALSIDVTNNFFSLPLTATNVDSFSRSNNKLV